MCANPGVVKVTTFPKDARVYVNGNFAGFTPMDLEYLPLGNHLVEVRLDGYVDYSREVTVEKGKNKTVAIELKPYVAPVTPVVVPMVEQSGSVQSASQSDGRDARDRRRIRLRNSIFGGAVLNEIFVKGDKKKDVRKVLIGGELINEITNKKK
jgi:hypothetical protein